MPGTSYANVRPQVTFTADIEPGEDAFAAAAVLTEKAESFLEEQCDHIIAMAAARDQRRRQASKREKASA